MLQEEKTESDDKSLKVSNDALRAADAIDLLRFHFIVVK